MVFLSHSHKDKELLETAVALINSQGARVYVDHEDFTLTDLSMPLVAYFLRKKIEECSKFILLASDKATGQSRWVPWELGFADGRKKFEDIAVLPVQERSGEWQGSEYIGLYSHIEEWWTDRWKVIPPDKIYGDSLGEWLLS